MKLISAGDSFIFGTELSDQKYDQFSKLSYPSLVAASMGIDYTSVAFPGIANNSISRRIYDYCIQQRNEDKFVVVGWTFPNRYEFYFYGAESHWQSITPWTVKDAKTMSKDLKDRDISSTVILDQLEHNKRLESAGVSAFATELYKRVALSRYWEAYSTLKEMVHMQNFFKLYNIPYIYTVADSGFLFDQTGFEVDQSLTAMLSELDMSRLFLFPDCQGFYVWAVRSNYPIGDTHPLEEAHRDAAIMIRKFIDELDQKNY